MSVNLENSAMATSLEKVSFHSSPKERQCQRMLKLPHNCAHLTCSKFSKLGFNSTWSVNFQMFKLVLEKAEEPEIKLPTFPGLSKKQESSRKTFSALLNMPKPLTVCMTTNWKILQEMGIPDHLACFLRNLYADQEATTVRTGHGTMDWFKLVKEYDKVVCCHPAF